MRLLHSLVIVLLLGFVSTENLVRVTTPISTNADSTDFANSTFLDHELIDSDDSASNAKEGNAADSSEDNEKHSDEAKDDHSDVSDEVNEADGEFHAGTRAPEAPVIPSLINQTFGNRQTFSCPRVKSDLKTGTSVGDLSPEDIQFIASMGDGVAAGIGLWPGPRASGTSEHMDVEYKGASFVSGGDANMDGLVTIPNILREFAPELQGFAHGTADDKRALAVSGKGARTKDLPKQALELMNRLSTYYPGAAKDKWIMVFIAIGTEELCESCSAPNERGIREALDILHASLNKALVILLGPTHVSQNSARQKNILKKRCECSKDQPPGFMESVAEKWTNVFGRIQVEYDEKQVNLKQKWGLLTFPQLTVTSRKPQELFAPGGPIMSRKGHSYMSKWLWNKLMGGVKYNLSQTPLSEETYYCPSSGCPYFRTNANMRKCAMLSIADSKLFSLETDGSGGMLIVRRTRETLYSIAIAVVIISFFAALVAGFIIYNVSKRAVHGRFDEVPETVASPEPPKVPTEAGAAPMSRKNALNRQSTTTRSTLDVPTPTYYGAGGTRKSPERSESTQLLTEP